jgi:uncharacterized protein
MKHLSPLALIGALLAAGSCLASPVESRRESQLEPNDMSIQYWAAHATDERFDPKSCVYGVFLDKTGQHEEARVIFQRCAEQGNLNAMPWMSYLEENGYDRPSDPVAAADWDKRLAETGSSLGQFNYGLDLLRGHGVARDPAQGRALIDRAAEGGDRTARELAAAGYDPEAVTPEADKARYRLPQF